MTFARTAAAALVALVCALVNARSARADPNACATAAEDGQKLRAAGKLRAARARFVECEAEACPTIIRTDCVLWGADVAARMPTIIVDASDENLRGVRDVEVIVDGDTVAQQLDGAAIALDPGPHTLVFHRPGSPPIVESVVLKPGVRGRLFAIKFVPFPPPAPPPLPPPPVDQPAPVRGHTVWPWVVVGIGGGVIVLGAAWTQTGSRSDQNRALDPTTTGVAIASAGAVFAAIGLLWHFLEPTGPVSAAR